MGAMRCSKVQMNGNGQGMVRLAVACHVAGRHVVVEVVEVACHDCHKCTTYFSETRIVAMPVSDMQLPRSWHVAIMRTIVLQCSQTMRVDCRMSSTHTIYSPNMWLAPNHSVPCMSCSAYTSKNTLDCPYQTVCSHRHVCSHRTG